MKPAPQPTCPACQTPLRLPSRGTAPFEAPCPECGELIAITFPDGRTAVSHATEAKPTPIVKFPPRPRLARPKWLSRSGTRAVAMLREPLVLTWLAAGLAACVLGFAFYRASTGPITPAALGQTEMDPANATDHEEPPEGIEPVPAEANEVRKPTTEKPQAQKMDSSASPVEPEPELIPVPPPVPPPRPVVADRPKITPPPDLRVMAQRGLAQRVIRFEQTAPTAFETIRGELAEIIGVPIRYAGGTEPILTEVSVTLTDATLAEILERIAGQVGLSYRIDQKGILLISSEDAQTLTNAP